MARVRKVESGKKPKNTKTNRVSSAKEVVKKPLKKVHQVGKKEVYLPLPDNKAGKFLNKRRSFVPKYFRESWAELKLVTWPTRKETWKLTLAVFVFAISFGAVIALVDFGLDKIFKALLLK